MSPDREFVANPSTARRVLEADEMASLANVLKSGEPPDDPPIAQVLLTLSRELLQAIGIKPPTRHKLFVCQSQWWWLGDNRWRPSGRCLYAQPSGRRSLPIPLGRLTFREAP